MKRFACKFLLALYCVNNDKDKILFFGMNSIYMKMIS